jgi:hypothetical protein
VMRLPMRLRPTRHRPTDIDVDVELAALADGSLGLERRERLLLRAQASPELTGELRAQRQAVAIVRAVQVEAPPSLHRSIQQLTATAPSARARGPLPRPSPAGALAVAALVGTAVLLALNTGLNTGASTTPTVLEASVLAMRPAAIPAPAENPRDRRNLVSSVEGIPYPYWNKRFGWWASGARVDRFEGRAITTVFYANHRAQRIGYSIVAGQALPAAGGRVLERGGVRFRLLEASGASVVTWRRSGHTCILASSGVGAETLLRLATWET